MKRFAVLIFVLITLFYLVNPHESKAQSLPSCGQGQANGLTDGDIDHYDLVCIYSVPDSYIASAASKRFLWIDRSVGILMNDGLNCMATGDSYANASSACKRGLAEEDYLSNTKYNRSNWEVAHYGDGGWYDNLSNYINNVGLSHADRSPFTPNYSSYNAINFEFSYLSVGDGQDILSPTSGFFVNQPTRIRDVYDMREFEADYPSIDFVYATTSLSRSVGTQISVDFNNQMRSYALSNNLPLIDFADIGSHSPSGGECVDNLGRNLPALCDEYTDEVNGGHPNGAGKMRTSKAMWLLMASLSGWRPGGSATVTPTRTVTATQTPTRTPTPRPTNTFTPTPTVISVPGDANGDGRVNGIDYTIWLSHFGQNTSSGPSFGDFNRSGSVDGLDYVVWIVNFTG